MKAALDPSKFDSYVTPTEFDWLVLQSLGKQRIVEIGSYLGYSTIALALNGSEVFAVDDFYGPRDVSIVGRNRELILEEFLDNTAAYPNIRTIVCDHAMFKPLRNTDMVFIDGSHDYISVMRDIIKWMDFKNLLLCGHDYAVYHADVKRAVHQLFGNDFALVEGTTLWFKQL